MSYYPLNSIPDYYGIDSLLTEEHKLIRQSVREWVESFVMPKIDKAAQDHTDLPNLMKDHTFLPNMVEQVWTKFLMVLLCRN
jgi:glutaryl-CoA dehydrogenase